MTLASGSKKLKLKMMIIIFSIFLEDLLSSVPNKLPEFSLVGLRNLSNKKDGIPTKSLLHYEILVDEINHSEDILREHLKVLLEITELVNELGAV